MIIEKAKHITRLVKEIECITKEVADLSERYGLKDGYTVVSHDTFNGFMNGSKIDAVLTKKDLLSLITLRHERFIEIEKELNELEKGETE